MDTLVTVIKSVQKSDKDGERDAVRYQVIEGTWDNSMEVPPATKLTKSYYKAFEYAAKLMGKLGGSVIKFVVTDKVLNEPTVKYNKETKQVEPVK